MQGKTVYWGEVSYKKLSPQWIGKSNGIAHFREKSEEIYIFLYLQTGAECFNEKSLRVFTVKIISEIVPNN